VRERERDGSLVKWSTKIETERERERAGKRASRSSVMMEDGGRKCTMSQPLHTIMNSATVHGIEHLLATGSESGKES
jgi:hypothetical protein